MRLLRRKEQNKFLEADADDRALLERYKAGVGIEAEIEVPVVDQQLLKKAEVYLSQNVSKSTIQDNVQNAPQKIADKPTGKLDDVQLKQIIFSEAHRKLLHNLDQLLGERYRVFTHLPLEEFLELREDVPQGRRISFIICDAAYLQVAAGVEIQSAGPENLAFLSKVFSQVNVPLVCLTKLEASNVSQIREKLGAFLMLDGSAKGSPSQACPLCQSGMQKRKISQKGESMYRWVCIQYPACKGNSKLVP